MKRFNKLIAIILAIVMVAGGLYVIAPEGSAVKAATTDDATFSLKMQAREHKNEEDVVESLDLRFVSSVDHLDYKNVGFEIYFQPDPNNPTEKDPTIKFTTSTVLKRISAVVTGVEYKYSPKVIDVDSEYFITGTMMGISAEDLESDFYVRAFYTSLDGSTVTYGVGRYFNLKDATRADIVNIPVKIAKEDLPPADAETKKIDVTITDKAGTAVPTTAMVESWVDGYAHLNVDVPAAATNAPTGEEQIANKENLASASKIAVGDKGAIYRNLKSTRANNGADSSWYTVYNEEGYDKFVIATDADLEGLKAQVNNSNTFAEKTIYMVSDIAMNAKEAVDWTTGTININVATGETYDVYTWTESIGRSYNHDSTNKRPFNGVFDGQGHTISGIYSKVKNVLKNYGMGLFGCLESTDAKVQNLRLTDSYFTATNTGNQYIGSIAGWCKGTISNVYSNATVDARGSYSGGLVGRGNSTLIECWYDGVFKFLGNGAYTGLGGILGDGNTGDFRIENCLNTGTMSRSSGSSKVTIGGFVGGGTKTAVGEITSSLFAGTLSPGTATAGLLVAGTKPQTVDGAYAIQGSSTVSAVITGEATYQGLITDSMTGYGPLTAKVGEVAVSDALTFYDSVNNPDGKWTLRNGKVPALRSLTTADALYTPDTEFDVDADGYYLISTPEELYGFAKLVNESAETTLVNTSTIKISTLKAKLTKNIRLNDTAASTYANTPAKYSWTPIGEYLGGNKVRYQGHFDGQGYNISGIYCKIAAEADQGIGLFGAVHFDGRVENLKLTNSYFEAYNSTVNNMYLGSIAGYNRGCIDKVYSDAIVKGTGSLVAGIAGRSEGTIDESWFAGSVEAGGTGIGGIVGYTSGVTITNCLNTGSVTGTNTSGYVGGLIGDVRAGTHQISNSLNAGQLSSKNATTTGTVIGKEIGTVTLTNVYAVKDVTYTKLIGNGAQENGSVSGIKERADITGYGVLNSLSPFDTDNIWVERINDVPGLARFTPTSDRIYQNGYYLIGSADDLEGFATEFNAGRIPSDANAKLIADITVNPGSPDGGTPEDTSDDWSNDTVAQELRKWTPIGEYLVGNKVRYQGHFDGQGYSISGIYCKISASKDHGIGLFGAVQGDGRVENLKLTNSYFEAYNQTSNIYLGSIAGYNRGCIDKVYSDAIVKGTGSFVAGIAGRSEASISESWFAGSVEAGGTGIGGIVGYTSGVTITNCLNTGSITGTNTSGYVGGLVGDVRAGTHQISNSLNAGQLSSKNATTTGTVIGKEVGTVTLTNVYAVKDATYTKLIGTGAQETGSVSGTTGSLIGHGAFLNIPNFSWDNDYTETAGQGSWVIREGQVPVPKALFDAERGDVYADLDWLRVPDAEGEVTALVTEGSDSGNGYLIQVENDTDQGVYNAYMNRLKVLGFTEYVEDGSNVGDEDGQVVSTTLIHAEKDIQVTLSHAENTDITLITAFSGLEMSAALQGVATTKAGVGYSGTLENTSLHMPYQEQDYGDSYVIQLKNSHFIVFDGGTNAETGRLIAYLETLVPEGETPVVDAWFISHAHIDHIGALVGMTRDEGYTERIYVEGIYFNEPGDEVLALADSSNAASYIQSLKKVVKQLKTTNGQAPAIYHPQAGQKYYFYGDVEIDVMFSQEWIAIEDYTRTVPFGGRNYGPAGFNESSTWLMVHIPQGQKHYKFLSAADARMIGMTFAMGTTLQHQDAAYSKEYLKVNVMNAFHHALNLSYDFADYCELQDILLVTRKTIADVDNGQLTNYNNSANVDVYYYGQGTTVLTFTDTDIAVNQIAVPTE